MFTWLKNRLLLLIFKKPLPKKVESRELSILVVSTTGVGDTLFALPSLPFLRKLGSISFLTTTLGKSLLQEENSIDSFFVLPKSLFFSFFSLKRTLKRNQFDLIFVFHASQRLIFPLCASLKPKRLVGTFSQNKGLDALFTDLVPWKSSHEVERRLEQISLFTKVENPEKGSFYLTKKEKEKRGPLLLEKGIPLEKPLVAIHPGAQDDYKCWPLENFQKLLSLFKEKTEYALVLVGGQKEYKKLSFLRDLAPYTLLFSCVRELAIFLEKASLFIANDTGPMHLASCLEVPTLALFSPTDPKICGPYKTPSTKVIAFEKTCIPCLKRKCILPFCMHQISPEKVFALACTMVEKGPK